MLQFIKKPDSQFIQNRAAIVYMPTAYNSLKKFNSIKYKLISKCTNIFCFSVEKKKNPPIYFIIEDL